MLSPPPQRPGPSLSSIALLLQHKYLVITFPLQINFQHDSDLTQLACQIQAVNEPQRLSHKSTRNTDIVSTSLTATSLNNTQSWRHEAPQLAATYRQCSFRPCRSLLDASTISLTIRVGQETLSSQFLWSKIKWKSNNMTTEAWVCSKWGLLSKFPTHDICGFLNSRWIWSD